MPYLEKSTVVNAPIDLAYTLWTQFEEFPRFLESVYKVRQIDDRHMFLRTKIGFKLDEWEAEIVEQTPPTRVAWRGTKGARHTGTVLLEALDPERTRVTFQVEYQPEGFMDAVGNMLGFLQGSIEADLRRFKQYIETHGKEMAAQHEAMDGDSPAPGYPSIQHLALGGDPQGEVF